MRILFLFFALQYAEGLKAQNDFSVSCFKRLPHDLTARALHPVEDANGDLTCLIKVQTTETGMEFQGGALGIVKVQPMPAEYWVYVPRGSRVITIAHPKLGLIRDYPYPITIAAGEVYELCLSQSPNSSNVRIKDTLTSSSLYPSIPNTTEFSEPELIFVEGGSFQMGCTPPPIDCEEIETPVHSVVLSSFQIGKYEVTQAQWRSVMGSIPENRFAGCDSCPVQNVSWSDIQVFIWILNQQTGKAYRLPTEAEWEYAARGGNKSKRFIYAGSNDAGRVAWNESSAGLNHEVHPVGQKLDNELGLYDMSGNVLEWCQDWVGYYTYETQTNPLGPVMGYLRSARGGSYLSNNQMTRVSYRLGFEPDKKADYIGFRLAHP